MIEEKLNSLVYVNAIRTKNQALLYSKHNNKYVREHCNKIIKGEKIIRKVKDLHIGKTFINNDSNETYVISGFPKRTSLTAIIKFHSGSFYPQHIKTSIKNFKEVIIKENKNEQIKNNSKRRKKRNSTSN
jgi:hypothetical protein